MALVGFPFLRMAFKFSTGPGAVGNETEYAGIADVVCEQYD